MLNQPIAKKVTEKDNFTYLLIALILLLFFSACVEQFIARTVLGQSIFLAMTAAIMSIGVLSVKSSRFAFRGGLLLALGTAITSSLIHIFDFSGLTYLHLLFMLLFFILTLREAAKQALFSGSITKNNIIGSICIYLLLGLIWTTLYSLLNELIPHSFNGLTGTKWQDNFPNLIYFSYVTLTTLGFGDLLPTSPLARFLVYMESIIGTFYMAVVVSSLVGSALNNKSKMS